jgi:anti-sigma regulatory factor (Ser/Thr protein kinase)
MTAEPSATGLTPAGFIHTAVIAGSQRNLRAVLVPAVNRLVRSGQPVLMVVGDGTAAMVRDELGADAEWVQWGDPAGFYQRLGFAYEGFRRYLADQHAAGQRVHVIAEPDLTIDAGPAAPAGRAAAYLAYESVCNETYAPYGCPVTCIWDSRRYPSSVIGEVRHVHTHELTETGLVRSPTYVPPRTYLARRNDAPLDDVPPDTSQDLHLSDPTELGGLRAALWSAIERHPFTDQAADDIILTVTEVAANGLAHGAAPVRVRVWHPGDAVVVQVDDSGGYPLPADAGYRRPAPGDAPGGRGLWLARQLADTVSTHTRRGTTTVRLHFPVEITNRNPG